MGIRVTEIMVPVDGLTVACDEGEARRLLDRHAEFDVIPIGRDGQISSCVERGAGGSRGLGLGDLAGDSTTIVELVRILRDRPWIFVLGERSIVGYVHFSDLNKEAVKIPLFALLSGVERRLAERARPLIGDASLDVVLGKNRADCVRKTMKKMREGRAELGWVDLLYFREIARFAAHFGRTNITDEQIGQLNQLRNHVVHTAGSLVGSHEEVVRLSEVVGLCASIDPGAAPGATDVMG